MPWEAATSSAAVDGDENEERPFFQLDFSITKKSGKRGEKKRNGEKRRKEKIFFSSLFFFWRDLNVIRLIDHPEIH